MSENITGNGAIESKRRIRHRQMCILRHDLQDAFYLVFKKSSGELAIADFPVLPSDDIQSNVITSLSKTYGIPTGRLSVRKVASVNRIDLNSYFHIYKGFTTYEPVLPEDSEYILARYTYRELIDYVEDQDFTGNSAMMFDAITEVLLHEMKRLKRRAANQRSTRTRDLLHEVLGDSDED